MKDSLHSELQLLPNPCQYLEVACIYAYIMIFLCDLNLNLAKTDKDTNKMRERQGLFKDSRFISLKK